MSSRRSLGRVEAGLGHLKEHLGGRRACDITTDRITAYVAVRQAAKAANATINPELAALKRMFRLGEIAGKVAQRPYIPMLQEDNARKGFFAAPEFRAMLAELPDALKPAAEVAYVTGWRIRSELPTRQWMHVDFEAGWIRLEPGETKNRDGRMFPMTPTLRTVLARQRAQTRAIERATGQVIPWVFHRDGRPIKYFRRAWLTACKAAQLPHRIPHDFRRTAVRNLERAGVPVGRHEDGRPQDRGDLPALRDRRREHAARGRGEARGAAPGPARRPAGGGPAENRQSNGKVAGWRHAARGRECRGSY